MGGGADVQQQRQQVTCVTNADIPGKIYVNYFYMSKNETDLYPDAYTNIGNNIQYNKYFIIQLMHSVI